MRFENRLKHTLKNKTREAENQGPKAKKKKKKIPFPS